MGQLGGDEDTFQRQVGLLYSQGKIQYCWQVIALKFRVFHGYNLIKYFEGVTERIFGAINNRQHLWKAPLEKMLPRVWAMEWWPVDSQGEQVKSFALK